MEEIFRIEKNDAEYPLTLRNIADAPKQLYARGNLNLLRTKCFSVVGSRAATEYARRAVNTLIPPLTKHLTIVSGMALGADALAHKATIEAGGFTLAVLGNGLDDASLYPRAHLSLAHHILKSDGCLVSEYAPGTRARPEFFPARNRIVAGLSLGVLIVEAAQESGTMITARLALDYGRDVFAVPGSIFTRLSEGTNKLLATGALFATCANDILSAYGVVAANAQTHLLLSPDEEEVLTVLKKGPTTVERLTELCRIEIGKLLVTLSQLELRGLLTKNEGKLAISG